tara:strand:- start:268 stop:603 length:336 start_codon:yes stop_codon:yes gene_type:complete
MIMMSDRAAIQVGRLVAEQKLGEVSLRVGVKGGGCSGFSYSLGFDDNKKKTDQVSIKEWQPKDLEIWCDPKSFLYLNDTIIDFEDGLMGKGFKFVNPNAVKSCGCGESFSV